MAKTITSKIMKRIPWQISPTSDTFAPNCIFSFICFRFLKMITTPAINNPMAVRPRRDPKQGTALGITTSNPISIALAPRR
jgi:hypothetical protein